ncbi:MAG TPA: LptF/LptG family permease [Anaeromyxobacteraceae bacterium]|nr:LptF/LptG family permease [Anaeromyxobacteraceae bacterium]
MILARYVAWRAAAASAVALAGVVAIFLAVDFVDNAPAFRGEGWLPAVLELYANKAAVVAYQVAPAALLLGAGIAASTLRQTREYTAMRALGIGPWGLAGPILGVAVAAGAGIVFLHDVVGVRAAQRADELGSVRFGGAGDRRRFQAAHEPKRWFRGADGRRVYHLRGAAPGGGFERVTVLELEKGFRLARRIDAARMRPAEGEAWELEEVEERTFLADGTVRFERSPSRQYRFDEPPGAFSLLPGRPADLRFATLGQQIEARRRLGLATERFELERANRIAYPLVAAPAVLLAVALALRRNRKGHVAASLLEAVGVSLLVWAVQGMAWAFGLSGRVAPWLAAWAPDLLFLLGGLAAVRRAR